MPPGGWKRRGRRFYFCWQAAARAGHGWSNKSRDCGWATFASCRFNPWEGYRERCEGGGRRAAEAATCFSLAAAVHAFDETLGQVCAAAKAPASVIHKNSEAAVTGSTRQQSPEGEAS